MLSFSNLVFSQKDSLDVKQDTIYVMDSGLYPNTWLYRWSGSSFSKHESSIGIVPSIQVGNELYLGVGISKARFFSGEGVAGGYGTTIGIDYNPIDKIFAPKVNAWYTLFAYIIGGNIGMSGYYYVNAQESNIVLRPEIGIGFVKVFLNYGYNISLQNDYEGISKHTFTLSYYHTFLPFKKKK